MHIEINHTSRQSHGLFSGSTTLKHLRINNNEGGHGNIFKKFFKSFFNNKKRDLTVNVCGDRLKT